jgi:hypothetical protein
MKDETSYAEKLLALDREVGGIHPRDREPVANVTLREQAEMVRLLQERAVSTRS